MGSEKITGLVDIAESVFTEILNKINNIITKKFWHKQNNEAIIKIFDPILIIWVDL